MTEKENKRLIRLVYEGEITQKNLPDFLYNFTFSELIKQVEEGYGKTQKLVGIKKEKAISFRININVFSGAKTYQNIRDLRNGISVGGKRVQFKKFEKFAKSINDQYNKNWLKAEMQACKQMSISANKWDNIEDKQELFPLLKYVTVGDGQVRPDHAAWDGLIFPVNDPFWDTHMPPNDWGCRCDVQQLLEGDVSSKIGVQKNDSKVFSNNPGKYEFIFDPKTHPYFKGIPSDDKRNNFGLGFK